MAASLGVWQIVVSATTSNKSFEVTMSGRWFIASSFPTLEKRWWMMSFCWWKSVCFYWKYCKLMSVNKVNAVESKPKTIFFLRLRREKSFKSRRRKKRERTQPERTQPVSILWRLGIFLSDPSGTFTCIIFLHKFPFSFSTSLMCWRWISKTTRRMKSS